MSAESHPLDYYGDRESARLRMVHLISTHTDEELKVKLMEDMEIYSESADCALNYDSKMKGAKGLYYHDAYLTGVFTSMALFLDVFRD